MRKPGSALPGQLVCSYVKNTGKAFCADGVRLDFTPRRGNVPILTAAMGVQALRLCSEIADGAIISNLVPTASPRRAVAMIHEAAARLSGPAPREIAQHVLNNASARRVKGCDR